ncbi:MAG TPA: hypothetical protein VEL31_31645 [Ktedonobacteraceae bacterium]|nr:hypothetical protein [Ktedonobacteraceae bacterium]
MQVPRPYVLTSERITAQIDDMQMAVNEGPRAYTAPGYHSVWIAEVPFIVSEGPKDFAYESVKRLLNVLERQQRFVYDLAQLSDHQTTFELRLVTWPQSHGPSRTGIAFLGKVFHQDAHVSYALALRLWDRFSALFPREAPFSYPLVPVRAENERTAQQTHSFAEWFQPLPVEQLVTPGCIVELRKHEDWPLVRDIGGALHPVDYIPQPFEPALDYSALGRLFEALAQQNEVCVVAITLRPQRLTHQEIRLLYETLDWYRRVAEGKIMIKNPLVDVLQELNSADIYTSYLPMRATIGIKVYEALIRELENLFLLRLQVLGFPAAQDDLVEALGSEMTADVDSPYPSRWNRVEPSAQELGWARFNAQWLEFARWGISPEIRSAPDITRFRQLVTAAEAMGAFRLPVASSGGLAGIEVRDEPFLLPTRIHEQGVSFSFGLLQDRGMNTEIPYTLSRKIFRGPIAFLGRDNLFDGMVLPLFLRMIYTAGLPWVLIRSAGPSATDPLPGLAVRRLRIDPSTEQQAIQPFFPPAGVELSTFLNALQSVFAVSCQLEPAAAILLRQALAQTYRQIDANNDQHSLKSIIKHFTSLLQNMQSMPAIISVIEKHVLLPLQEISEFASDLFSHVSTADLSWTTPTIIEVAQVGSEVSQAILSGCLWSYCTLACSKLPTSLDAVRSIVGLETAHTVFGTVSPAVARFAAPTTTLAQTLVQQGVCPLLVSERADLLDQSITTRAGAIVVTHGANESAQEQAAHLIGASRRQRARMRLLHAREAIVAIPGTVPVLITA